MALAEKKKDIYSISFIHRFRRVVYDSAPFCFGRLKPLFILLIEGTHRRNNPHQSFGFGKPETRLG